MNYKNKLIEHYFNLASADLAAEMPTGEDARFSPEFEMLEAELAKDLSLHDANEVDWQKVLAGCEHFLGTLGKDLRVAIWLTWALHQRESFTGLVAGLTLLHHLCESFWPTLHPRKSRTRVAAFNWLLPRLDKAISGHLAIAEQLPLFRHLAQVLRDLEKTLSQHLGSEAPLLLPLSRRLEDMVARSGLDQPTQGSVGAAIAQVREVATRVLSSSVCIDSEKEADKCLRTLQEHARPLCTYWLKQKVSDIRALRLSRTLLWLPIEGLPEHNTERMTSLRGIAAEKVLRFRELFEQGKYADLLMDIESAVARAPFWLDGQRMAWECLQALQAEQASRELEIQSSLFLQRLPGLETLQFHDGTPFADLQTRAWLSAHVMPHARSTPASPATAPVPGNPVQPRWESALAEALVALDKSGLKAAVQQLKHDMKVATGGRELFLWQLAIARLCIAGKKYELAKPQLEALDQRLQDSNLGEWEPALVLEVLALLHDCCDHLPQNHAVRERKEEIHRRLCHLDPEAVLE
ncbi:type VI secretion system protein TssA [Pseudomonas sp. 148P]|uniref:Type VI secretion system protein TssA n=1 Tax=Pseudomonas ulcerans TaxID=3115852 RepID=A0ABU7HUN2_9PSED|nr:MULTISPECIES: type VI secretion system protein TssA [unclassified Pseudomonas]MEE1924009.1 type VI secretion system protein TssA [Pseudomonas sp. 147P]MEE1935228.1 type VI secretion system protein TssA [Pseudomonas sp. 148P]